MGRRKIVLMEWYCLIMWRTITLVRWSLLCLDGRRFRLNERQFLCEGSISVIEIEIGVMKMYYFVALNLF